MPEIFYQRGINVRQVRVGTPGQEALVELDDVLSHLCVQEAMRIPVLDYPDSAKPGEVLTHFNLPVSFDRTGFTVVMPKITEHGYFYPPDNEKLPLLSFKDVWRAKVINFLPHIEYKDVPRDLFIYTIGGANDPDSLMEMMVKRYKRTLPDITTEEILSQGISVTQVRLEEVVTW